MKNTIGKVFGIERKKGFFEPSDIDEGLEIGKKIGHNTAIDTEVTVDVGALTDLILYFTIRFTKNKKTLREHIDDKTGYCKDLAQAIAKAITESKILGVKG